MDEKTPHMHLSFVPITEDGRLSAKDILGNRKNLTKWQDDFWKFMVRKYPDLERGESASETGRTHIPPRLFKEATHLNQQRDALMALLVKGSPRIGPPKTKTSYRDIPVPTNLREVAKEFRKTTQQYIWHGEDVPICNPSVFRKHFKKALTEAGNVRLLSPHCCRHTYVSQLQAQGVPMETIQSLTGHADVDMTEHYLHVQKEVKENAAGKLDSLFNKQKPALHIA